MSVVQQVTFGGFNFTANHAWPETWEDQITVTDTTQAVPGSDAAPARDARLAPRVVKITGHLAGFTDRQSFRDAKDAFQQALNYGRMDQLYNDTDRYLNAKCISANLSEDDLIGAAAFDCSFICPDPFYYSTVESTTNAMNPASGDTLTATNGGTASLYSVWTITPGSSAVGTITLTNVTTGLAWAFGPTSITIGEDLVVDALNGTVTLGGVNSLASLSGVFWPLLAGNNTIRIDFTGITAVSELSVTSRARYF
jgi:hypothetical protein